MENWLNENILREFDDEHLKKYKKHLIETIGNCTVFLAQVNAEQERRDYGTTT